MAFTSPPYGSVWGKKKPPRKSPCNELMMQKRKRTVSEASNEKKARAQVEPNRQLRPQILRKATRFLLHSSRWRIFLNTRSSMTRPELTTAASSPVLMTKWAIRAERESVIQHLSQHATSGLLLLIITNNPRSLRLWHYFHALHAIRSYENVVGFHRPLAINVSDGSQNNNRHNWNTWNRHGNDEKFQSKDVFPPPAAWSHFSETCAQCTNKYRSYLFVCLFTLSGALV